jgi:hypothetical protein
MTTPSHGRSVVGFAGLGDQGPPMAEAIAEAGFPVHAPGAALGGVGRPTPDSEDDVSADVAGRQCEEPRACLAPG